MTLCFFFNDPAPPEIYPLSLHDALPIFAPGRGPPRLGQRREAGEEEVAGAGEVGHRLRPERPLDPEDVRGGHARTEEDTSELQSRPYLVCRPLLEKKKYLQ